MEKRKILDKENLSETNEDVFEEEEDNMVYPSGIVLKLWQHMIIVVKEVMVKLSQQ